MATIFGSSCGTVPLHLYLLGGPGESFLPGSLWVTPLPSCFGAAQRLCLLSLLKDRMTWEEKKRQEMKNKIPLKVEDPENEAWRRWRSERRGAQQEQHPRQGREDVHTDGTQEVVEVGSGP